MENNSKLNTNTESLKISSDSESYLKETGGWASFLAILGFILVALMVAGSIGISLFLSTMNDERISPSTGYLMGGMYLLFGFLFFFPVLYLFRFSSNIKKALENKDNENLDQAFKNIKSHYKFTGIFTIIFIVIYIIVAIALLIFGSFF